MAHCPKNPNIQWWEISRIQHMEVHVSTICLAIFCGDIHWKLHKKRPYLWNLYLHFRILKFPFKWWSHDDPYRFAILRYSETTGKKRTYCNKNFRGWLDSALVNWNRNPSVQHPYFWTNPNYSKWMHTWWDCNMLFRCQIAMDLYQSGSEQQIIFIRQPFYESWGM